MFQPAILQALRDATGPIHDRLERRIDLDRRIADPRGRADLVEGFHRLHAMAEPALADWLGDVADLQIERRQRADHVAQDLRRLGRTPGAVAPVAIASRGEALGWAYVLEGSSLGGRTILRGLAARGVDATGLGFMDPYGEATGERWRTLVAVMARETDAGRARAQDVLAGARLGFEAALQHLVVEEAACPM
jgi:heme oxygenase (biliverdin-IX-beta and delta-forming)